MGAPHVLLRSPGRVAARTITQGPGDFMKKRFVLAALLAAAPFAASAQALSYTFVEGGYGKVDVDGFDGTSGDELDVDGGYGRGSVRLADNLSLFGQYSKASGKDVWASNSGGHHTKYDLELGELGLGYRHPMSDRVDLIAEVAAVNVAAKVTREERPFFGDMTPYSVVELDDSSTAARVSVGMRGAFSEQLEGWAKAGFIGDTVYDGGFTGAAGLQFRLTPTWGIVGEVEVADAWTLLRVGVRASF